MKKIGMLLMTCLLLLACSTDDDIEEIFIGNRFKITGLTYNGQKTVKDVKEFYEVNDTYWIAFSQSAITGVLQPGMTIEGTWNANGKNRELTIDLISPKNANGASDICSKVFSIIKNATSYSGDKNVLRIKRNGDSFIELSSEK
jgi:hypothetical protein